VNHERLILRGEDVIGEAWQLRIYDKLFVSIEPIGRWREHFYNDERIEPRGGLPVSNVESRLRHLVCMTFDFDAISPWILRGMTTPTPMSRGDRTLVLCQTPSDY